MTPELLLRPIPPPLWFVTNGENTIGPVSTNLLLRGIAADRVPNDCMVRERTWRDWRTLDSSEFLSGWRLDVRGSGNEFVVELFEADSLFSDGFE